MLVSPRHTIAAMIRASDMLPARCDIIRERAMRYERV